MGDNENRSGYGFLDLAGTARFLTCTEEEVLQLVATRKIRSCVFPLGGNDVENLRFWWEHLRDFGLSCEQMPKYTKASGSTRTALGTSLAEDIIEHFHCETRRSNGYINLCSGQIVFAQLHPRRTGGGVDLALRECGDDNQLPKCETLTRIDIQELAGYRKTNRNWLEGKRHTDSAAAAFHVPCTLTEDLSDAGWKELEELLKYAEEKMDRKKEIKNDEKHKTCSR